MVKSRATIIAALIMLTMGGLSMAKVRAYNLPPKADPAARYLFYLPGLYVETHGGDKEYRFHDIVDAFSKKGFVVASEVRPNGTDPGEYAAKLAGWIKDLLAAGVPAGNISLVGHSKGGYMSILAAHLLKEPGISYVIMAGCFPGRLEAYPRPKDGRFLSIYDTADHIAASCRKAFPPGRDFKEIALQTGEGHKLFWQAKEVWLSPVLAWLQAAP